jgi:hypothetical protein
VLVFARLKGLANDTRIVEYLKSTKKDAAVLSLMAVPDRTTVGRWWKRYPKLLEKVFNKLSDMLQLLTPTTLLVVDFTFLEDLLDAKTCWGKSSRGRL